MSDIRLVNVVPIVNGWNDAAKKNLEEAKTLMASGNHLDYNAGVVKESVANPPWTLPRIPPPSERGFLLQAGHQKS